MLKKTKSNGFYSIKMESLSVSLTVTDKRKKNVAIYVLDEAISTE